VAVTDAFCLCVLFLFLLLLLLLWFQVIASIVLLNLLIALMGDSFARVQENAVAAWRLEQARIVLEIEVLHLSKEQIEDPTLFPPWLQILLPADAADGIAGAGAGADDDGRDGGNDVGDVADRLTAMAAHVDAATRVQSKEITTVIDTQVNALSETIMIAKEDLTKNVEQVEEKVQKVSQEMEEVCRDVQWVNHDMLELKHDVQQVKTDVVRVKHDVQHMKSMLEAIAAASGVEIPPAPIPTTATAATTTTAAATTTAGAAADDDESSDSDNI